MGLDFHSRLQYITVLFTKNSGFKMDFDHLQFICTSEKLSGLDYFVSHVEYQGVQSTAVTFYYQDQVYAYLNNCKHGQRRLDCGADTVFNTSGELLSCSMHGFEFEPTTGECLSPKGAGKKLQQVRVIEKDGAIYFADKDVRIIDPLVQLH